MKHSCLALFLALAGVACTSVGSPPRASSQESGPSVARWQKIAADEQALPEGTSVHDLALELASFASLSDPVLRDEIGYEVSARWIGAGRLSNADLHELFALHLARLHTGLGEGEGDGVFLRSFSALHLSLLIARDNRQPFLEAADVTAAVSAVARSLREERDRRGWAEGKGWAHPIAHAADLTKFLARHRFLRTEDAAVLFSGLEAGFEGPNAWGENDRLAAAAQSLFLREEFDAASLQARCGVWIQDARAVWQTQPFDTQLFRRTENRKQFLRALHARLSTDPAPSEPKRSLAQRLLETLSDMP
ncbi:MAG TPA: DUF2785 domain-containing protein [Planctomycetota bacterium]|nr:DUF2785 domain-containing protein [Planctomycetota bacterium]